MENIVVTPHGRVSACCGLTFEHIPEMILGRIEDDNLGGIYTQIMDDLLKLWIKVDGPLHILKTIYGEDLDVREQLNEIQHQCHACALLHHKDRAKGDIGAYFSDLENIKNIITKFNVRSSIKKFKIKSHNSLTVEGERI